MTTIHEAAQSLYSYLRGFGTGPLFRPLVDDIGRALAEGLPEPEATLGRDSAAGSQGLNQAPAALAAEAHLHAETLANVHHAYNEINARKIARVALHAAIDALASIDNADRRTPSAGGQAEHLTDDEITDLWASASDPEAEEMSIFEFARALESRLARPSADAKGGA